MNYIRNLVVTVGLIFISSGAQAELPAATAGLEELQCANLVKDCFATDGLQRTNCFYSASTHPFCEDTEMGSLANRRWVLSPTRAKSGAVHAFLGPELVDEKCVLRFDARFEKLLKEERLSDDALRTLAGQIEECKRDINMELQRQ